MSMASASGSVVVDAESDGLEILAENQVLYQPKLGDESLGSDEPVQDGCCSWLMIHHASNLQRIVRHHAPPI